MAALIGACVRAGPPSGAMPFSGDRTSTMPNGVIPNGVHSAHTSIIGPLGNHGGGMVGVNRSGRVPSE